MLNRVIQYEVKNDTLNELEKEKVTHHLSILKSRLEKTGTDRIFSIKSFSIKDSIINVKLFILEGNVKLAEVEILDILSTVLENKKLYGEVITCK